MLPPRIRRAVRLAIRRDDRLEADTDEEIRFHLRRRVEDLVARGLSRQDAELEAGRRFGPPNESRALLLEAARLREERLTMLERLDAVRHDVSYGLRQLRRAPGVTAAVVITFALGIGANATMFGIIDRLLLRPPGQVADPDQVFAVTVKQHFRGQERTNTAFSYPAFTDLRDGVAGFAGVAMQTFPRDLPLGRGTDARAIKAVLVNGEYFTTLGVRPALGRLLVPSDARVPDGEPVVVLSHAFWERAFGRDPGVLGRTLDVGSKRLTVIGVAARGFAGPSMRPIDAWLPITTGSSLALAGFEWATSRTSVWFGIAARVKRDVTPAVAAAQATAALRAGNAGVQGADSTARVVLESIIPVRKSVMRPEAKVATLLGAVAAAVLLIACANVANLLLARASRRRRETAVRLALGISRSRLVVQLLVESVFLALLGGVAALLVAQWGSGLVRGVLLSDFAWVDSPVDGRVLAFTAATALTVGVLAGLVPALQASSLQLTRALRDGVRGGSIHRTRTRVLLLLVQAVLAVVLLVGTGLFVRSLRNVVNVPLGTETDRVLVASMDLDGAGVPAAEIEDLYRRFEERVKGLPGVEKASIGEGTPFNWSLGTAIVVPGVDSVPGGANIVGITEDYFATVGTKILRGRAFSAAERRAGTHLALVSNAFARRVWPSSSALGECVKVGGADEPCATVVGVVEDAHQSGIVEEDMPPVVYVPLEHGRHFLRARLVLVRPAGDRPERMIEPLRRALQTVSPSLPYVNVRVMRSLLDESMRPWRLGATMFGAFGALALVLSGVGLYGVIAYSVAQRLHELGVRVALGARSADLVRLVVLQGLRVAVIGIVLGEAIALAVGRLVEPLLFEVSPRDPAVFGAAALVILVVSIIASLIPAIRATRVDPVVALRSE